MGLVICAEKYIKTKKSSTGDYMCYKLEIQKKNEDKLQKRFTEDSVPLFIQKYFVNIESKAGAINYWIAIKDLLLWLMEKKIINKSLLCEIVLDDFCNVESEDITMYLKQKEESGISPTTLETRKNIFSSFWKYLQRSNKCSVNINIIESVTYKGISSNNNLAKKLPSEDQIKAMEEKLAKKNDDFLRIRNLTVFRVLKGSGLRESELVGLELTDLFLDEDIPYVKVVGKGKYRERESRNVLLTNDARSALVEWLVERRKICNVENIKAVFITKKIKRMTESDIKKMFKSASNSELSPHMIRHYYATIATKIGGIAFAQQNLGHTSVNTTINNYANGSYGMKEILANM